MKFTRIDRGVFMALFVLGAVNCMVQGASSGATGEPYTYRYGLLYTSYLLLKASAYHALAGFLDSVTFLIRPLLWSKTINGAYNLVTKPMMRQKLLWYLHDYPFGMLGSLIGTAVGAYLVAFLFRKTVKEEQPEN